jgi:hypothetical protein
MERVELGELRCWSVRSAQKLLIPLRLGGGGNEDKSHGKPGRG